jgi:hypothetical protein
VRRGLFFFAVLAACVGVAAAGAASKVTIPARSSVTALAADGTDTSFATTPTVSDCDRVFVWQATTRHTVQLGKKQRCKAKSNGITSLAVTKGRALWLTETGTAVTAVRLWTATATKPTPKPLVTAMRDIQSTDPAPILVGSAGGGLLPYAMDSTVTVLRSTGIPAYTWPASGRVVAMSARSGRVAVAQEGARVTVLDSTGHIVSVDLFANEVSAVALTAKGLLVQRGTTLELRRGTGAEAHQYTVPATAQLDDADSRWAVWSDGKLVHVIRLPDGAPVAAYPGTSASLAGNTLYVASGKAITIRTLR